MTVVRFDTSMTFGSFVVGPENRLAWQASRTAAESPGAAYNPLFIYSDTGLGKTHLLIAIARRAKELQPGMRVIYSPLVQLLRELSFGPEAESYYRSAEVLLIDDLQFIGHHRESHRTLFHLLDNLLLNGRQVVLACDRPPLELGQLDDRLISRFSGGLVVDIGRPVMETRRAILDMRLAVLGGRLRPEVMDAIARATIDNVRQLKGALNRVLAEQRVEEREIEADEVDRLLVDVLGDDELPWLHEDDDVSGLEFREFLSGVSSIVEAAIGSTQWRENLARAILKWEAEGYMTTRLESYLDADESIDAEVVIAQYERDISALKMIEHELRRLGVDPPEDASLHDPDQVDRLWAFVNSQRHSNHSVDKFFLDGEKVVWNWPVISEEMIEVWSNGHKG